MVWDAIYKKHGVVQDINIDITKNFIKSLPKIKSIILDLGCGTGNHTFNIAKQSKDFSVLALDESKEALRLLNKKQTPHNNIKTIHANFKKIPLLAESVDTIICTRALHHARLESIKIYTQEINRVLKENGLLHLVVLSEKCFRRKTGKPYYEDNTRIHCDDLPDSALPHHFFTKKEIIDLFPTYDILHLEQTTRQTFKGIKPATYYDIILQKKSI